ncbi:LOW QUALITY PROTEIN: reverse transcriptase [Phytophthora megakarya]|uniref:Reverse transcriptase n=1 Tax=Phytophthora megakarya TaxID=4795 RepID=A0A225UKT8_9STRA|nr:LOW QUALITY PROTEIN: reverse transcriptase [Phytophthora megakarya]
MAVETLNVLTRTCTGTLENPPTDTSELTSLPVMSWKRFAKSLYHGRIEQLCILSERERMTSEAEELRQLFAGSATESEDTLSAKTKKEHFEEQTEVESLLRDSARTQGRAPGRDPCGASHEIDLVPGSKYCVTRQWPLPREQSEDTLSAKTKKERFEEQSRDSLKSSPYYKILREHKDVLPDEIPAELPQDKGIQHEIDLVPRTKYCVTHEWPLPR